MARAAAPAAAPLPPFVLALLAALVVLWGTNWPMMKLALMEVPPWTFRVICLLVGGLGLLAIARLSGERLAVPPGRLRPMLSVAFINVTLWHLCSAYGLLYIESGRAAIIAYTMPVWASVLAVWVLGERLEARRVVGLALGMAALAVLIGPDFLAGFGEAPLGALAMLGAALSWAVGTVALKRHDWGMPVTALTGWMLLIGGVPILVGWLFIEAWPDLSGVSLPAALATLYAATVAMIFCYCTYVKLVTMLPASVAATSTLGIPVSGVFSSALMLGEPIGLAEVAALALVLGALSLVLLPRAAGPRSR
ncbi:MAG TPA: DMT family transporter [Geminicoccaceae bacterium]|nr:DMT family transporter [Geminicoccaceae bacterium]